MQLSFAGRSLGIKNEPDQGCLKDPLESQQLLIRGVDLISSKVSGLILKLSRQQSQLGCTNIKLLALKIASANTVNRLKCLKMFSLLYGS